MKEIMINYDNSFQDNNITRVILQFLRPYGSRSNLFAFLRSIGAQAYSRVQKSQAD